MAGEGVTLFGRVATPRLAMLQKLKPLRAYCLQLINPHRRHINFPLVNSRSRYAKQCRQLQHATRQFNCSVFCHRRIISQLIYFATIKLNLAKVIILFAEFLKVTILFAELY